MNDARNAAYGRTAPSHRLTMPVLFKAAAVNAGLAKWRATEVAHVWPV